MLFWVFEIASLPPVLIANKIFHVTVLLVVTGSIARSASRRYLIYSEADFEVFGPAGAIRCTDGGEIWHAEGNQRSTPPCQISPLSVQRQRCRTPKPEIFTQI